MAHSFHITPSHAHLKWSRSIPPVLTIPSESEVTFDLKDGGNNQVRPDNEHTAIADFDFAQTDPAFGPVYIENAEPGDTLKIEILALEPGAYGWTGVFGGFGLLSDDFDFTLPELKGHARVKIWDLKPEALLQDTQTTYRAVFKPGISVPVRPFLGVLGIAPAEHGELSTIPPYALSGGNIDTRYLTIGSTLYLPVQVPGALFSCGDGHAAQGDGEVCGTAIETPMKAKLRLTVEKAKAKESMGDSRSGTKATVAEKGLVLKCPHYTTPPQQREVQHEDDVLGVYAALGIHADIREASRMALRGLLEWLQIEKDLTKVEAYMLASVAASLKITEAVDMPHYAVACSIPLNTFAWPKSQS